MGGQQKLNEKSEVNHEPLAIYWETFSLYQMQGHHHGIIPDGIFHMQSVI